MVGSVCVAGWSGPREKPCCVSDGDLVCVRVWCACSAVPQAAERAGRSVNPEKMSEVMFTD